MGQPQRVEAGQEFDSVSSFSHPEANASSVDKQQGPEMFIEYANEQHGTLTYLTNGTQLNIEPLRRREFIDSNAQMIVEAEHATAEGRDLENDVHLKEIHDQLGKSKIEGGALKCMAAVFREYGDQIGMLKRGESGNPGLDSLKLGNQLDFSNPDNLILTISGEGEKLMMNKLKNPPQNSIGEPGMKFRFTSPNLESDYLVNKDGKRMGFSVFLSYSSDNADGKKTDLRRIFFLFAKDRNKPVVENDVKDEKVKEQGNIEPQTGTDEETTEPDNLISFEDRKAKKTT